MIDYSIHCHQCQIEIEHPVKQAMQFSLITNSSGQRRFAIRLIDNLQRRKPFSPFIVNMILDADLVNRWETHDSLVFRLARNGKVRPIKNQHRHDDSQHQIHSSH